MDEMENNLSLSEKDLPEIKEWDIGKNYKLEISITMTGKRIPSHWDLEMGKRGISADFKITGVKNKSESDGAQRFREKYKK